MNQAGSLILFSNHQIKVDSLETSPWQTRLGRCRSSELRAAKVILLWWISLLRKRISVLCEQVFKQICPTWTCLLPDHRLFLKLRWWSQKKTRDGRIFILSLSSISRSSIRPFTTSSSWWSITKESKRFFQNRKQPQVFFRNTKLKGCTNI